MTIKERKNNLKRVKKQINLFHLSTINHDGDVFKPRIPFTGLSEEKEDTQIKRVCFSSTISGAYRAITFCDTFGEELFIHIPINLNSIIKRGNVYKPSENLVFDSYFTGEYWIKRPVKMKCIGKAKFYYNETCGGYSGTWRPKVKFKWLEKYK